MTQRSTLQTLGGAVEGFRDFAAAIKSGVPTVRKGSMAEEDQALSGNIVIPHAIVSGLVLTVADHVSAWAELAASPEKDVLLLHMQADYTLFRPVLEGLVEVIWILDGTDSPSRARRALEIARIEYKHGLKLTNALRKARTPDDKTEQGIAALGRFLRTTASNLGYDPEDVLSAPLIDPSSITRKIANRVPGPTLQTFNYWAITSAHAHGQFITTLRHAIETPPSTPQMGGALYEPDEELIADLIKFIGKLLEIAVNLLNEQGYELRR